MASAPSLELCDHFRDNRCPSCLVTRTDAGTAAAIEILIEEEEITPFGIILEQLDRPVEWPLSVAITPEDAKDLIGKDHLLERGAQGCSLRAIGLQPPALRVAASST